MKMYNIVLVILLLMIAIPDIYFYNKLKDKNVKPIYIILHLIPALYFTCLFFYIKFGMESSRNFRVVAAIMWMYFVFLIIYIPKLIHILFYFLNYIYKKIFKEESLYIHIFRVLFSVMVVAIMLTSAYVTPHDFEIVKVKIEIPNLPPAFKGYKIVQLSDIHLGSWNNKYRKLKPVIKLVNEQNADIIVFTGDMVNNYGTEAIGWVPYFNEMKSKSGKYAVLGNHDYGDYTHWKVQQERIDNQNEIKKVIRDFGFKLLLNEHTYLRKDTDSILLVGVENWGKSKEWRYSDITKSLIGTKTETPKILLSHDPTQWEIEIMGSKNIALTLSGHTHAAQLGVKIGGRLFSPASFIFKYWSGLYKMNNQYLYVNRGIGYIGLPMHIGVSPEITVIELQ